MEQNHQVADRDCPFTALFQQIINEMKNVAPLWEDFTVKSTKLHVCLRATIQALTGFLDAFQKIADAATSTPGATKDIGTALTRICLRHRSLEERLKTFSSSLMDCLIVPLQDKLEEWKKQTVHIDKEHAKEHKRSRSELKKRSMETLRLQKKLRKGNLHNGIPGSFGGGTLPRNHGSGSSLASTGSDSHSLHGGNRDLNRILEVALRDGAEKRQAFEDSEKQAIRVALTEERSRFCLFVSYLKPVVEKEVDMLHDLMRVQEAMQQLEKHSADPFSLPAASEQVISDLKGSCDNGTWSFHTPPSSPSSLGSRKSSMCSISSANSSSSGSAHSPSHKAHHRAINQPPVIISGQGSAMRFASVSSQDSGFTSQDTLFSRYSTPLFVHKQGNQSEGSNTSSTASSNSSTPSSPYPPGNSTLTTWPNPEDSKQFERAACAIMNERPHTISTAYEQRSHPRPPLTVYTFQPPTDSNHIESPATPVVDPQPQSTGGSIYQSASEIYGILRGKLDSKPPVPKRCSSLERPQSVSGNISSATPKPPPKVGKGKSSKKQQGQFSSNSSLNEIYASNVPDFNPSSDDMIVPQPVYVNMHELKSQMAKHRQPDSDLPPPPPELMATSQKNERQHGESSEKVESSLGPINHGNQSQIMMVTEDKLAASSGQEGDHFGSNTSQFTGSKDEFRLELQSMINSMNSIPSSFSSHPYYSPGKTHSVKGNDPLYDIPEGRCSEGQEDPGVSKDIVNNNVQQDNDRSPEDVSVRYFNGSGIAYLRQNRHRSSLQHSNSFDAGSSSGNFFRVSNANSSAALYGNGPESLPVALTSDSSENMHHRLANPHIPVLDASSLYQHQKNHNNGDGSGSVAHYSHHVGLQRNNSLPRPHSIAAPQQTTFMQYRLNARKRDFV